MPNSKNNLKVLQFKSISPFFEQERDGIKPFTIRLWDSNDNRFMTLPSKSLRSEVKITNPTTKESFSREYEGFIFLAHPVQGICGWVIIYLGERIENDR